MRKSPVFTSVVILSFALGIGANTAIFTLVDRVLLRMLPVRQAERLVALAGAGTTTAATRGAMRSPIRCTWISYARTKCSTACWRGRIPVFSVV